LINKLSILVNVLGISRACRPSTCVPVFLLWWAHC